MKSGRERVIRWGSRLLTVGLLAGVAAGVAGCRPIQAPPAMATSATDGAVAVALDKAQDSAVVSAADGRVQIDLYSASGIGGAAVTWGAQVAKPPVLRLHLRGLEELRLANGSGEIVASVASSIPHTIRQAARSAEGTELQPITAANQEWLDISWAAGGAGEGAAAGPAAALAFPLEDGYFDVVLRDSRLVEPGTTLQIRWIDFYR